jgi:hypothetical protein
VHHRVIGQNPSITMDPSTASFSAANPSVALNSLRTFEKKRKGEIPRVKELANENNDNLLSGLKLQGLRAVKKKNATCPFIRVGVPRGYSAIADGNIIALHCEASNCFIQLKEGGCSGKVKDAEKLLIDSKHTFFTVVHCGGSDYAFYNVGKHAFLRMDGDVLKAGKQKHVTDALDVTEVFDVRKVGSGHGPSCALYSPENDRLVHMRADGSQLIGIVDGDKTYKTPAHEQFSVVLIMRAPTRERFVIVEEPEKFVLVEAPNHCSSTLDSFVFVEE